MSGEDTVCETVMPRLAVVLEHLLSLLHDAVGYVRVRVCLQSMCRSSANAWTERTQYLSAPFGASCSKS